MEKLNKISSFFQKLHLRGVLRIVFKGEFAQGLFPDRIANFAIFNDTSHAKLTWYRGHLPLYLEETSARFIAFNKTYSPAQSHFVVYTPHTKKQPMNRYPISNLKNKNKKLAHQGY